MQSQMTRRILGVRCAGLTTPGQRPDVGAIDPWRSDGFRSELSASRPTPEALRPRNARLERNDSLTEELQWWGRHSCLPRAEGPSAFADFDALRRGRQECLPHKPGEGLF